MNTIEKKEPLKYVLSWKVTTQEPTGCPDRVPDPYTGSYPSMTCAVYHSKSVVRDMTKTFDSEKEVLDFMNKSPSICSNFLLNGEEIS